MNLTSEQIRFTLWNTFFSPISMAIIWAFFPVLSSHDLWELAGKQGDYGDFLQTIAINALYLLPRYLVLCYATMILPVGIISFLISFACNGHPTRLIKKRFINVLIFLVLTIIFFGLAILIVQFYQMHYVAATHLAFGLGFGAGFSYVTVLYIMARKNKEDSTSTS